MVLSDNRPAEVLRAALTICFLSSMHAPDDKRVHYKEAVTLARAGFRVVHVAPGNGSRSTVDGVEVVTFRGRRGVIGRIGQLARLYRLAAAVDADVLHCNEVESWLVGVALRLTRGKRVVFDVHELYAANFAQSRFPRPLRPLVVGTIKSLYRVVLPFTDRVVLAKRSAALELPASGPSQVLVQNFVDLAAEPLPDPDGEGAPRETTFVTAIHLGAINRFRGWPQLLDALALTSASVRLRVIGRFGDNTEREFLDRVSELGLVGRVEFEPWIPYHEVMGSLRRCSIGLIVFQPVRLNFTHALPHKLFDYMLAELPVIVPDFAAEVAEIVRDAGCGLVVDTTDPAAIASALDRLAGDPEERERLGRNGRAAVLERYNWAPEGDRLIEMYDELAAQLPGRAKVPLRRSSSASGSPTAS